MTQWRPWAGSSRPASDLLCRVLARPAALSGLGLAQWDALIRQARAASLLAVVAHVADRTTGWRRVPERPRRHLIGAHRLAARNAEALRWDLECLAPPLAPLSARSGTAPVLLKGVAYVAAGLPNAAGRIAGDVDLLFPRESLAGVEDRLRWDGWVPAPLDDYDQRYYRAWMHELPPMRHGRRGTTLDLHHNIVPETFAVRPDPARLLAQAVPVPGWPAYRMLCPPHMVLHAAAHLFSETEWDTALRDLYDIHRLAEHFARTQGEPFWDRLLQEAEALDLERLLYYALRHAARRFATPVPDTVMATLQRAAPGRLRLRLLDAAFDGGFRPRIGTPHRRCVPGEEAGDHPGDAVARAALFMRGHWLKMPPWLLARHLFHKAWATSRGGDGDGRR